MNAGEKPGTVPASVAADTGESRLDGVRSSRHTTGERSADRVLEERARQLAAEPAAAKGGEWIVVVEFALANERYLLSAQHVREVATIDELTPLPGVPEFVVGLVNLRGEIVSVIDISSFLGLPRSDPGDLHQVLFLEDEQMTFGIVAESIYGARRLALADIQPPPPTLGANHARYVTGMTRERTVVLDGARLLADPDVVVREHRTGRAIGNTR
ncbi:MAG: chemotaxis protein CheW [Trueperaceae bacterium]